MRNIITTVALFRALHGPERERDERVYEIFLDEFDISETQKDRIKELELTFKARTEDMCRSFGDCADFILKAIDKMPQQRRNRVKAELLPAIESLRYCSKYYSHPVETGPMFEEAEKP